MALDIIANETWDDVDKAWDAFTLETWDGWIEFSYALKIYDTSGVKVAEITGDLKNPTLTNLEFENLQQGGCGAFSFTLAKPYTQATITYDYKVEIYIFNPTQVLFYTGKIINKPVEGTDKPQTYLGWGYFNELEKKIIDTEIAPGSDIAVAVTSVLDTYIIPYTSILKDATLIETVSHDLVATIDFEDEYANEIFKRLTELAVDYKFGVNEDRKFYFQAIDTSVNYYWHVGKHLTEFHPEEDPSDLVKKVIAVYPEVFTDGYRLKITSEAGDYAGLYDKRFSLPEIVNPFSTTDIASGITPTTNPVAGTPANMTDGDYSTLWESGANQASGHYIIIDLTTDYENISAVVIDSIHANAQEFNAKSVKIEVKPDGGSYATMLSSDDNTGWKPTLTFRPTTGRYVKISLTGSSSEELKIGEVEIYQLDLTDAQRWADWKLTTLENVKKRATARISNIQSMIMDSAGLVPIKPVGKARIFDRNGTKIDDYQVIACKYRLSSGGFSLDMELGAEEITTTDRDREWQRRIRELENSGVRRAKNLSLSKGFQLSKILGTYIGENEIQTKQLAANSVVAGAIAVVGIDANGQLVLGEVGSGNFDDIPEGTTYQRVLATALTAGEVNLSNAGVINKTADNISETGAKKWAGETGADITGDHEADVDLANLGEKNVDSLADTGNYVRLPVANGADSVSETAAKKWAGETGADITGDHEAATITGQGALATLASVDLATGEVTNKTAANIAETAGLKWAAETGADITSGHTAADTALVNTVAAATVQGNAADGKTAHTGTVKYRTTGAPTNNPTPTTVAKLVRANGSMDIKLGWGAYTQGASQADVILLFWEKSTEAADMIWDEIEETWDDVTVGEYTWDGTSLGVPTVNDSCVAFNVNTAAASYFFLEGCNPNSSWSFGIAAARRTENGWEIGAIQSPGAAPDWQDVTGDSPNFEGNVHGVPAVNIQEWADDPGARVNTQATLITPGKIVISGATNLEDWRKTGDLTKIDGGDISTNTVTATQISVSQLDAISADIGTLTVGTITTGISIGGNWRKIYDETIAGSAVNSFVVPDLDGNADVEYIIRVRWVSGGGAASEIDFMMRPNADGGANYGVENYGAENPNAPFSFHGEAETGFWVGWVKDTGELSQGIAHLYAKSGFERTCISLVTCQVNGKDVGAGVTSHGSWGNTGDNITSLTFADLISDTGIGIGSRTEIWKRVA